MDDNKSEFSSVLSDQEKVVSLFQFIQELNGDAVGDLGEQAETEGDFKYQGISLGTLPLGYSK